MLIYIISRVVAKTGRVTEVSGRKFLNFGAHYDNYPSHYLTAAAAIGMTKKDVDLFISRLDQVLEKVEKAKQPQGLQNTEKESRTLELDSEKDHGFVQTDEEICLDIKEKMTL